MAIPRGFIKDLPKIRRLISYYNLHQEEGPVNIDKLINEDLKYKMRFSSFDEDQWIRGMCFIDDENKHKKHIIINNLKPYFVQRVTKAHEVGHLYIHDPQTEMMCNPRFENKALEREANYFAAYVMVPLFAIEAIKKYNRPFEDIADGLHVTVDMVYKRYELYTNTKEYEQDKFVIKIPML